MNPEKSFWWLLKYRWTSNADPKLIKMTDSSEQLFLLDLQGKSSALRRLECDTAERLLGVMLCPEDNGEAMTDFLRTKADTWAEHAKTKPINTTLAWTGLKAGIMKSLEWPLVATTITESQCDSIMSSVVQTGLRSARVQSQLDEALVYGPEDYLGMGLPNLYYEAGIQKVLHVLQHAHSDTLSGKILRANLQGMQTVVGTEQFFLNVRFHPFQVATEKSWMQSLWRFVSETNITFDYHWPSRNKRVGDGYLTDLFLSWGYTGSKMKSLQKCRIYLQATTVADIADVSGTEIYQAIRNHQRRLDIPSTEGWPHQPRPPGSDWRIWDTAIKRLGKSQQFWWKLAQPLGDWYHDSHWEWYFSPTEAALYKRCTNGDQWLRYIHLGDPARPLAGSFVVSTDKRVPPEDAQRAGTRYLSRGVRLEGYAPEVPASSQVSTDHHPGGHLSASLFHGLNPTESYMIKEYHIDRGDMDSINEAIQKRRIRVVSDGSYYPHSGRAAFQVRIETTDHRNLVIITQHVPGSLDDNDSYQAESAGIWAAMIFINQVVQAYGSPQVSITIACDGKAAIHRACQRGWEVRVTEPHYDILLGIQKEVQRGLIIFRPKWIRSHAEKRKSVKEYSRTEYLNTLCDAGAKRKAQGEYGTWKPRVGQEVYARSYGRRLVRDISQRLRHHITVPTITEFWQLHRGWTEPIDVDWESVGRARRNYPPAKGRWVLKAASGNAPTNSNMLAWGFRESGHCAMTVSYTHLTLPTIA